MAYNSLQSSNKSKDQEKEAGSRMTQKGSPPPPKKSSDKPASGKAGKSVMPDELLALQQKEAEARRSAGVTAKAKKPLAKATAQAVPAKEITLEEIRKFVRGEMTLAQLEGLSRDQLYDFAEMGYTMFKSGKVEDACKVFEGLVTYNPYDAYFHSALGAIYQKMKRYEEAIRQYNLALKFNPYDTCSLTNRGETYLTLGRLQEAADDFKKSIEQDPEGKDPWGMRARALVLAVTNALSAAGQGKPPSPGSAPKK